MEAIVAVCSRSSGTCCVPIREHFRIRIGVKIEPAANVSGGELLTNVVDDEHRRDRDPQTRREKFGRMVRVFARPAFAASGAPMPRGAEAAAQPVDLELGDGNEVAQVAPVPFESRFIEFDLQLAEGQRKRSARGGPRTCRRPSRGLPSEPDCRDRPRRAAAGRTGRADRRRRDSSMRRAPRPDATSRSPVFSACRNESSASAK